MRKVYRTRTPHLLSPQQLEVHSHTARQGGTDGLRPKDEEKNKETGKKKKI